MDTFGKTGALKRSDLGMRVSATVARKKFSLGFGYELGCMDINKNLDLNDVNFDNNDVEEVTEIALSKVKTGNFFISIGYNF